MVLEVPEEGPQDVPVGPGPPEFPELAGDAHLAEGLQDGSQGGFRSSPGLRFRLSRRIDHHSFHRLSDSRDCRQELLRVEPQGSEEDDHVSR